MTIHKFGGSSLATVDLIDQAISVASTTLKDGTVLVASAMGSTTDTLQKVADLASCGREQKALKIVDQIQSYHLDVATSMLVSTTLTETEKQLNVLFGQLRSIVTGISLLKNWTPSNNDTILGFGERATTILLAARSRQQGIETLLLDSYKIITTDDHYMRANVLQPETTEQIRAVVKHNTRQLLVAQGFIAATKKGIKTTLGRGGSDYTATLFGAALNASEVVIWTDVTGIMTCDPRIVTNVRTLHQISYEEAAELAYFGARVIHPATIQPAVKNDIPIVVRNTWKPNMPGTQINKLTMPGAKAIACKRGIILINVTSSRMLLAYGFLRRIFEIFEVHKTPVDLVTTSEISVSMTIDSDTHLHAIVSDLEKIGAVTVDADVGLISIVGHDLWDQRDFLTRTMTALKEIPLKMMSLGSSDINLSIVVADSATETAVRSLHSDFFEE